MKNANGIWNKGFIIVASALLAVLIWVVKDTKAEVTKLADSFNTEITAVKIAIAKLEAQKN